jgi:hypothetical protein
MTGFDKRTLCVPKHAKACLAISGNAGHQSGIVHGDGACRKLGRLCHPVTTEVDCSTHEQSGIRNFENLLVCRKIAPDRQENRERQSLDTVA